MKPYLNLFRNRNFMLLWLAGAISNVGDFFNSLALVKILSTDPDHLGMYMALVMIAKVVPGVLLGPVAGVVADRISRRTIMVISDLLRAALVLGLVFVERPALIITLIFLAAAVSVFFGPASGALLPNVVTKEQLVTAGSLNVMTQRMAMLIGNGLGAAVLVFVGPHNVFYIDATSYVVSAFLLVAMAVPAVLTAPGENKSGERTGLWQRFQADLKESLTFLRQAAPVRHLLTTFGIAAVGDSAMNVLTVTFFTVGLGLAAESLGIVWALFGGASVIGALAIGAVGHKLPWRLLVPVSATYVWFMMMGALITQSAIPSITFMTLMGLGSGAVNVGAQAALGELVPDWVRGRVFGAWGMVNSVIYIVGVLSAGALSDTFGPAPTLMLFCTFYLLAGVYAFFTLRGRPAVEAARADVAD